ncbi:MAG: energy transducer TonB [Sulfuricurvum sp.]|uniref:energy transducer TonB family protein n=1 Tax=Sulfuricurvum sp. TaxID=2025608 RepID=UPI002735B9AC|nr:energy transducer TonB [Sulfuricurvum sp.]MDP2850828.1 energy transducer TonB [Sulfuricurvum sp.]
MKPNPSLLSLLIALLIHSVILVLVWYGISHEENEDKPFYKEKRFGVTLNEETDIKEKITPPSAPPQSSAISKGKKADAPMPLAQQPIHSTELKRITEADRESLPYSVLHHYGDEFFELSAGEQHYIIDNLQRIRKINEVVGTRLLRDRSDVDPMDNNVVEFILKPDGSISDLTLEKNRIGTALDELTLQTINLAHPKYPKPEQPTRVRIRVYIIVK